MINKKGSSLWVIVLAMLVFMGIFFGLYNWMVFSASNTGGSINSDYTAINSSLTTIDSSLSSKVEEFKDNVKGITEADNLVQVAWNGLKGLGTLFVSVPIAFLDTAVSIFDVVSAYTYGYIPAWALGLITTGIVAFIIFIIAAVLKGDNKVIE